jgi:hypothetical protein
MRTDSSTHRVGVFQELILLLGDLARTDLPAKNERKARGNGSRARVHFSITQRFS